MRDERPLMFLYEQANKLCACLVSFLITTCIRSRQIILLRLLGLALSLAQRTLADVQVHASVLVNNDLVHGAGESRKSPVHDTVGPVRGAGRSDSLCTTAAANLAESSTNKLLGVRHKQGCLADLAHSAGDKVRLHELDLNAVRLEFGAESGGPLLEESLAAAVGRKVGCGKDAAEGCHGEDQTGLALDHAGCDELCHAEGAHAVDRDDVAHLLLGSLVEGNGNAVAEADIVDQDGDIKLRDQALDVVVVLVLVGSKVHGNSLGLDIVLGLDFRGEGVELALGARDEEDVEALLSELEGVLFAETVGGAGDKSP